MKVIISLYFLLTLSIVATAQTEIVYSSYHSTGTSVRIVKSHLYEGKEYYFMEAVGDTLFRQNGEQIDISDTKLIIAERLGDRFKIITRFQEMSYGDHSVFYTTESGLYFLFDRLGEVIMDGKSLPKKSAHAETYVVKIENEKSSLVHHYYNEECDVKIQLGVDQKEGLSFSFYQPVQDIYKMDGKKLDVVRDQERDAYSITYRMESDSLVFVNNVGIDYFGAGPHPNTSSRLFYDDTYGAGGMVSVLCYGLKAFLNGEEMLETNEFTDKRQIYFPINNVFIGLKPIMLSNDMEYNSGYAGHFQLENGNTSFIFSQLSPRKEMCWEGNFCLSKPDSSVWAVNLRNYNWKTGKGIFELQDVNNKTNIAQMVQGKGHLFVFGEYLYELGFYEIPEEMRNEVMLHGSYVNIMDKSTLKMGKPMLMRSQDHPNGYVSTEYLTPSATKDTVYWVGAYDQKLIFDLDTIGHKYSKACYFHAKKAIAFFDVPIGIVNEKVSNDFSLFPNPTNHIITIQLEKPQKSNSHIQIYNSQGQLIQSVQMAEGSSMKSVNVEKLKPGLYFINVMNADGMVGSQPFMKSN